MNAITVQRGDCRGTANGVFCALALAVSLFLVPGARADNNWTFKFSSFANYDNFGAGQWIMNDTPIPSTEYFGTIGLTTISIDGTVLPPQQQFVTFCVEIAQPISTGTTYTYSVVDPTQVSGGYSDAIVRNARILYDLYYRGNAESSWTTPTAGAFQLALWELTHDTGGSLYTGTFRNNGATNTSIALGESYLQGVLSQGADYNPFSTLLAISSPVNQDLYAFAPALSIPFGLEVWPGVAILGAAGFFRIRRRVTARS